MGIAELSVPVCTPRLSRLAGALAPLFISGLLHAEPLVVERVVARVDGTPILLSELRQRAEPFVRRLSELRSWERPARHRALLAEAREAAIEAALFEGLAQRRKLEIGRADVDAALARIAADQALDVETLLATATVAGYPPARYRAELARQLTEQRLLVSEPHGKLGKPPSDPSESARWFTARRKLLLSELRRRAWVERLGRF